MCVVIRRPVCNVARMGEMEFNVGIMMVCVATSATRTVHNVPKVMITVGPNIGKVSVPKNPRFGGDFFDLTQGVSARGSRPAGGVITPDDLIPAGVLIYRPPGGPD